ncbi:Gfo/Idh/MocA family oxidoreductase [Candidatus Bathyarchaeota archaeon]|nr:Gfo/Idh/MocA family oxidoreductase [Candidatus Bathyarchaeota archaeon]
MLRLGIVGCGRVTTMFHLRAIEEVEGVSVAAVADMDESRMEEVRERSGAARGYLEYSTLLRDPEVNAVAINTPPRFHEDMVVEALEAGKHVLCEKPLSRSVEGCERIMEAQGDGGLVVMPLHNYGFTPALETAERILRAGEIGKTTRVYLSFDNNLRSYGSRTDFRLEERYAIVEDILPHVLSVVHVLVDPPLSVRDALGWARSYKVVDNLSVSLRAGAVDVETDMNWTSLIPRFAIEVEGDKGSLSMEPMKFPYKVTVRTGKGERTEDKPGLGKYLDVARLRHPAFRRQYEHFAAVVGGSEEPRFTVEDEVEMLRIMDGVVRLLTLAEG